MMTHMMILTVLIKDEAVEYWRNWNINETNKNKRNRPLKSVQNKFRRVSSERQIKTMGRTITFRWKSYRKIILHLQIYT